MARDPTIIFASEREMHAMRYQKVTDGHMARHEGNILALYHDKLEIVFLSDDWSGSNYSELSVLVHELTHHLQKVSAMRFSCPEEREKLAYEAQAKWLALFHSDLETEFEMDAFTLLVKTNCLH
jgi:hypothetical protein